MAGTFINNGDGTTTVQFTYSGITDKISASLNKVALVLWNRGVGDHGTEENPIFFTDLTNQEKLDLVDWYIHYTMKSLRDDQIHKEYDEAANTNADDDISTNYELGES